MSPKPVVQLDPFPGSPGVPILPCCALAVHSAWDPYLPSEIASMFASDCWTTQQGSRNSDSVVKYTKLMLPSQSPYEATEWPISTLRALTGPSTKKPL